MVIFFRFLKARARYFRIQVESITRESATFLDVEVYKGPKWESSGRLDTRLHLKATSQWSPLAPWSDHPMSVHRSWPRAELARRVNLCNNTVSKKTAADYLKNLYFVRFGVRLPPQTHGTQRPARVQPNASTVFLPLRFHAHWHLGAVAACMGKWARVFSGTRARHTATCDDTRACARCTATCSDVHAHAREQHRSTPHDEPEPDFRIMIAWRLAHKHLMHEVRAKMCTFRPHPHA